MAIVVRYDDIGSSGVERRHRLPVDLLGRGQLAVGDACPRRWDTDGEVVERLVGGLVVDGVPREGAVRLLHRPDLSGVGDGPAARAEVDAGGGRLDRLGGPAVDDLQLVDLVLLDRCAHDEVLAVVLVVDLRAVDGRALDVEGLPEVELELLRVGGGPEGEDVGGREEALVGIPSQVEVVVQRVDGRVADSGVVAVLAREALRDGELAGDRALVGVVRAGARPLGGAGAVGTGGAGSASSRSQNTPAAASAMTSTRAVSQRPERVTTPPPCAAASIGR